MKFEGSLDGKGLRVALVVGRFNAFVTNRLREGAVDCLTRHGVCEDDIDEILVPGAFEIPQAASAAVSSGRYGGVLCLGAVIRGATPHFDFVAGECVRGVSRLAAGSSVPVGLGVLTTDTVEQAVERAGSKSGNKGWDAALAVLEMASVLKHVRGD
jgi:6,7-dimethyl-8-ribityllumazine synthase